MVEVLNKKSMEKPLGWLRTTLLFLIAIFLFLLAIDLVGESVTMLGQDTVRSILLATSNPFIGLFIGLLATALVQSSSTVTAMTVAVLIGLSVPSVLLRISLTSRHWFVCSLYSLVHVELNLDQSQHRPNHA